MFTIIVPYYNMAEYLPKTLEALSEQTCQLFEVIIVDDGSAERLNYDVTQLMFSTKIIHTPNQGVSVARNIGASFAQFDWIIFLDAGDSFAINFLETMKGLIDRNSNFEFYASAFSFCKNNQKQLANTGLATGEFEFSYNSYLEHLCNGNYLFHLCSIVLSKKLFFSSGGFSPKATHGEDHEFILKALKSTHKCLFINEALFFYSLDDENSATRKKASVPIYAHTLYLMSLKPRLKNEDIYFINTILENLVVNLRKRFVFSGLLNMLNSLPIRLYLRFIKMVLKKGTSYAGK